MDSELEARLAFAHRLADAARAVIRPYFRRRTRRDGQRIGWDVRSGHRGRQARRAGDARSHRPDISERWHTRRGVRREMQATAASCWVLDPIDGTRAFIAGQPLWGTLIALEHNRKPVVGILDQPFLDERFTGVCGVTEFRNASSTERLKTRPCAALADAIISTTHPLMHFKDRRAGNVPRRREALPALALWRRLLRLRACGHGVCRSRHRNRSPALGYRAAYPHHRRRRWCRHELGGRIDDRGGRCDRRRRPPRPCRSAEVLSR